MPSNIEETKSLLEQILEAQRETIGVLRGIEGLLDSLVMTAENIHDATDETAFFSHGWFYRFRESWRAAKTVIKLTENEASAQRIMDLADAADEDQRFG